MATSKTPRQARLSILQSFKDHMDAYAWDTNGQPEVVYDNVNRQTDGAEFIHINVSHTGGTIAALGNEKYRRRGIVIVNMFVPEGNGQARIDYLAEAVLEWVETFAVAGVRLREPGYNENGSVGGYWQANIAFSFEYDAVRT